MKKIKIEQTMQYDYYKHQVEGDTWHLIRVSSEIGLSIALEKGFITDIISKNGPGKVIPVKRESNGVHVGHLPIPYILKDVNDEFNWETRVWGNAPLELDRVRSLLYQSHWSRTSEADSSVLNFRFSNGILYVNEVPLGINYDVIEAEGDIWIVSSGVKYKVIDINQYYLTLYDGRFVFSLNKTS